jgi:hypothetical protein
VFVSGGSTINKDPSTATKTSELFDPVTERWTLAGTMTYPRLYHSTALLLTDGTVAALGSDPDGGEPHEPHIEIYRPPYLFAADGSAAPRPVITSVPDTVGYGAQFSIGTANPASIAKVVLIRPGANTHAFDMDQRLIELSFSATAGGLTATTPPNGNIAPPGFYMLFLVDSAGVPSVARFVQLSRTPANTPPKGTITNPSSTTIDVAAGEPVSFAGSGTDSDGTIRSHSWVFPGGAPRTSASANAGAVTFATPGTYVVSFTVVDDDGENDPSPPTVTVNVGGAAGTTPTLTVSPASLGFSGPPGSSIPPQTLSITNTGSGALTWSASDNAPWLTLETVSGTAPSVVAVGVNTAGLAEGSYSGTITVTASGAGGSPKTVPVTLTIGQATTAFSDDFADGDHTDDWTVSPLGNAAGWSAAGGALHYAGPTNTNVYSGNAAWTDYTVEARFKLTNLLNYAGGIRGRVNPSTGAGYAVRLFPGSRRISLYRTGAWKLESGAPVELRRVTASFDATAFHTLALRMTGSTLNVYLDGALIITVTDATYSAGGITIDGQSQPVTWDDVKVVMGAGAPPPPPPAEPALSVTPATLTFSGPPNTALAAQNISIANTGGGTLTWSASDNAPWLTLGATTGTAPSTVAVNVSTTGLTAGTYAGTITVSATGATGSPRTVTVNLTVTAPPASAALSVTPAALTFSGPPNTALPAQGISIANTGGGTLTWSASDNVPWLTLGATSGTAPSTVAVNVNTTGLAAGTHNATISVTSPDATNSPQSVAVTLIVESSSPPPAAGAPTISRLSPPEGRSTGGTLLQIDGTNFASGTAVTVGGLAAGNVTIVSPTRLTAVAPAGTVGPAPVVVTNGSGSATATFTYLADASVLLADDFNDGNATGWTVSPLGNAAGWSVVDGMLRYAGGVNANVWAGDPGWTDYMVEATFKLANLLNYAGGIRGRVNPATGAGYAVRLFPGSSRISLYRTGAWKLESGAPVELRRVTAAFDATAFHTLALGMVGSTIEVYLNGVRIITVTDTTYTSGAVTIDGQSQPVQWDDVIVTTP